tara:strand:+ start:1199 stop:2653 length:1455 start_codon:yes stop_codon:yes gene_type:complete
MNDIEKEIEEAIKEMEEMIEDAGASTKQDAGKESQEGQQSTKFSVYSPMGNVSVDMLEFEKARKRALKEVHPPEPSLVSQMVHAYLGAEEQSDSKYYRPKLGALIKLHIDKEFDDYELVKEFILERGAEMPAEYSNVNFGNSETRRFFQTGIRFYQNATEKFVLVASVDQYDNDERIVIMTAVEGRGLQLLKRLEAGFYQDGALKNAFFDMEYNFIDRNDMVDQLIAWDDEIKQQLDKDVIEFLKIMPILRQKGLPNSRGIILSGPPGTGKTMMAKSLAAQANVTTILISAEMISGKSQIKNAFKLGRKLAPTLMIIEDIDTAGTVSRKFTDHPILGEYLQAMDGMESNDGILILATTNHTENIDPAISDRPGRFDRIIDVPLPNTRQRHTMIQNILAKMPSEEIGKSVISSVAKKSEGLSGAWVREVVQCALIEAIYEGKDKLCGRNLETGLADVLKRRGMAYQPTPNLSDVIDSKNAEVYTV